MTAQTRCTCTPVFLFPGISLSTFFCHPLVSYVGTSNVEQSPSTFRSCHDPALQFSVYRHHVCPLNEVPGTSSGPANFNAYDLAFNSCSVLYCPTMRPCRLLHGCLQISLRGSGCLSSASHDWHLVWIGLGSRTSWGIRWMHGL